MPDEKTTLPAVIVKATTPKTFKLSVNYEAMIVAAKQFTASLPENPESDEDFALCEKAVPQLQKMEKSVAESKGLLFSKIPGLSDILVQQAELAEILSETRLKLSKKVKEKKEEIKQKAMAEAEQRIEDRRQALTSALHYPLPAISVDVKSVVKGKRTLSGMRGALADMVAGVCEQLEDLSEMQQANLALYRESVLGVQVAAFPDLPDLVHMPHEEFAELVEERKASLQEPDEEDGQEDWEDRQVAEERLQDGESPVDWPEEDPCPEYDEYAATEPYVGSACSGHGHSQCQYAHEPQKLTARSAVDCLSFNFNMPPAAVISFLLDREVHEELVYLEEDLNHE